MPIKVNFDTLNPGARFDFKEDSETHDWAWVKIRAYTNEVMNQIRKEFVHPKVEYKPMKKYGQAQRFEFTESEDDKIREKLWDYVIMDWGGFADDDGIDLPCTLENKIKFMSEWPEFSTFVDKCLELLTPDVNEAVKASGKN